LKIRENRTLSPASPSRNSTGGPQGWCEYPARPSSLGRWVPGLVSDLHRIPCYRSQL